jgi:hypothetical protein
MTEQEWLVCPEDAFQICRKLDFLYHKSSERKFHLFRMACCRQIWHLLDKECYRQVIETAELIVDGQAIRDDLEPVIALANKEIEMVAGERQIQARASHPTFGIAEIRAATAAVRAGKADYTFDSFPNTASYACCIVQETASAASWAAAVSACWPSGSPSPTLEWPNLYTKAQKSEATLQGVLLLDIFGNPFRPAVADRLHAAPAVSNLAKAIYDERAFDRLSCLADALEDDGCLDAEILGHCRGEGPHVRGCWVIDLILGKK